MNDNPYQSPKSDQPAARPRRARRMIWLGVACLAIAAVCIGLTVGGMMHTFRVLAQASSPHPADLAAGISVAVVPAYAVVPLGLLGVVLVIVGLVRKR